MNILTLNRAEDNQQVLALAVEILEPHRPPVTTQEATLLLQCFNGNRHNLPVPLDGVAEFLGNELFSLLLTEPWGDCNETLQEFIDRYDAPDEWNAQIAHDPRVQFVKRLCGMDELPAAALLLAVKLWWNQVSQQAGQLPTLRIEDYFAIQD